jgi:glycerol-3-phosphate acyltransferase PlsY
VDTLDAIALGVSAVLGYLIGSVNFAVIVARRHGIDILSAGSGNPGATNVKRVIGKSAGNLVFALDALKGAAGAYFAPLLTTVLLALGGMTVGSTSEAGADLGFLSFAVGAAGFVGTLLGHCFSCFLRFRGGKGVASTIGGLLVLLPAPILVGAALWAAVFALTRYVSLASIVLGLSLPVSCWLLPRISPLALGPVEFWFASALAAFNVWTHRSNISRLLAGTENRFGQKA